MQHRSSDEDQGRKLIPAWEARQSSASAWQFAPAAGESQEISASARSAIAVERSEKGWFDAYRGKGMSFPESA
jgi:hypothetical protein